MGSHLKIGVFGGTFDPIHLGHLNLMIELKERWDLDHVLICPARLSPTKQSSSSVASSHRLSMVKLAVEKIPWIKVSDIEINRLPPSYTIDTVQFLLKQNKTANLYLMIGEDVIDTIDLWKEVEKLFELTMPLVGTRPGNQLASLDNLSPSIKLKLERGRTEIFSMDISSTRLRERLKNKLYCAHLLTPKVLDYIYENGLYCSL